MSQAKVDAHKEEKKHLKEQMKKKRRRKVIGSIVGICVVVVVVGWIAYSGYNSYQENKGVEVISINTTAITDYTTGL